MNLKLLPRLFNERRLSSNRGLTQIAVPKQGASVLLNRSEPGGALRVRHSHPWGEPQLREKCVDDDGDTHTRGAHPTP